MAQSPHPGTLFHLVPLNDLSRQALHHPDNRRFVSPILVGSLGIEVGFHVASVPGPDIAKLGRDNSDLVLPGHNVSKVHVAFELHSKTHLVLLSVWTTRVSPVITRTLDGKERQGNRVLSYGIWYEIEFAGYEFSLVWHGTDPAPLRALAIRDYQAALQQQVRVRSRYLPTETDSEVDTWHNTRLAPPDVRFHKADGVQRVVIGQGNFSMVFRTINLESGHSFAVKVIDLDRYLNVEQARAAVHREVKILQKLSHKNIIKFLNIAKWDTNAPEIFMPLRLGNLRSLVNNIETKKRAGLSETVLEQMLSALDYLTSHHICHRDVKPENILYWSRVNKFTFELADFGVANHIFRAKTKYSTIYYEAPELYPEYGKFNQSPKMDVWSLFATIADIHPNFDFPPLEANNYANVICAVRAAAKLMLRLAFMARENPKDRASASQVLVAHFNGRGLTTKMANI